MTVMDEVHISSLFGNKHFQRRIQVTENEIIQQTSKVLQHQSFYDRHMQ